jgi:hypothetical protein
MPRRLTRTRARGQSNPRNALYVGRGTKWGNPYVIGAPSGTDGITITREVAVTRFRTLVSEPQNVILIRRELRGRDLTCWCKQDEACHADVLLDLANTTYDPQLAPWLALPVECKECGMVRHTPILEDDSHCPCHYGRPFAEPCPCPCHP